MDEPFTKGSKTNKTWLSQAAGATANSCPLRMLLLCVPDIQRQEELSKASQLSTTTVIIYKETQEEESFFEAYLFQWKCYQKGQIFKPARAAPSLHFYPPY